MNLFFYENTPSRGAQDFTDLLRRKKSLKSLSPLPREEHLRVENTLTARSGDLLLLYAATDKELQALLVTHERFTDFQVILILKDHTIPNIITSHILKPRFITFADSDIQNLENVILKIQKHTGDNPYATQ